MIPKLNLPLGISCFHISLLLCFSLRASLAKKSVRIQVSDMKPAAWPWTNHTLSPGKKTTANNFQNHAKKTVGNCPAMARNQNWRKNIPPHTHTYTHTCPQYFLVLCEAEKHNLLPRWPLDLKNNKSYLQYVAFFLSSKTLKIFCPSGEKSIHIRKDFQSFILITFPLISQISISSELPWVAYMGQTIKSSSYSLQFVPSLYIWKPGTVMSGISYPFLHLWQIL